MSAATELVEVQLVAHQLGRRLQGKEAGCNAQGNNEMNTDQIRQTFDNAAIVYDTLIPKLIPQYHQQNRLLLDLIPFDRQNPFHVLDLGAGTGVLSSLILQRFPSANVTVFDLAESMLETCQGNLAAFGDRLTIRQGNFASDDIGSGYDLIISGLAIHHLDHPEKQNLFKRLFQGMNPGGIFLNRDIVISSTLNLTQQHHQLWCQYIESQQEDSNYWFAKYLEEDIPASVEDQLKWLNKAGFEDVGCHWRYLNFAIFGGRKPNHSKSA